MVSAKIFSGLSTPSIIIFVLLIRFLNYIFDFKNENFTKLFKDSK